MTIGGSASHCRWTPLDGMAAMPPVESLWRPLRLKMQCWERKREDWQKDVERVSAAPGAVELQSDLFARLDQLKRVVLACDQRILGESGGKVAHPAPL
jgi:hypothetical protein